MLMHLINFVLASFFSHPMQRLIFLLPFTLALVECCPKMSFLLFTSVVHFSQFLLNIYTLTKAVITRTSLARERRCFLHDEPGSKHRIHTVFFLMSLSLYI